VAVAFSVLLAAAVVAAALVIMRGRLLSMAAGLVALVP
jgi:hypothetical protein